MKMETKTMATLQTPPLMRQNQSPSISATGMKVRKRDGNVKKPSKMKSSSGASIKLQQRKRSPMNASARTMLRAVKLNLVAARLGSI